MVCGCDQIDPGLQGQTQIGVHVRLRLMEVDDVIAFDQT
jgi:hypothetical protein